MSNEEDPIGSEEEGIPGVQADKTHLFQELFGEESSEEEQPTPTNSSLNPQQHEFKRPIPDPTANKHSTGSSGSSQTSKTANLTLEKTRKRTRSVESPEDDNMDNEPLSVLPAFSSSIDNQDDLIIEEEQEIRVEEMPYIRPPEDCPLHYFKLAGVGIEPKPFEESNFQSNEVLDEQPDKKKKKSAPTTIRWRYILDQDLQNVVKESNTRVVKWSDGSMHLFVGKEAFDIHEQEFKDHHHLFIRQRKDLNSEAFLQCHGLLEKKNGPHPNG